MRSVAERLGAAAAATRPVALISSRLPRTAYLAEQATRFLGGIPRARIVERQPIACREIFVAFHRSADEIAIDERAIEPLDVPHRAFAMHCERCSPAPRVHACSNRQQEIDSHDDRASASAVRRSQIPTLSLAFASNPAFRARSASVVYGATDRSPSPTRRHTA